MDHRRVHSTPTGYGVIRVAERKRIVLAPVAAPSLVRSPASTPDVTVAARSDAAAMNTARPASAG